MKRCRICDKEIKQRTICKVCHLRQQRAKDPIAYAYRTLQDNATRRRKEFTITLDYFTRWCLDNRYIELKGRGKDDFTIDRKINALGYIPGNLQIMRKIDNSTKYHAIDKNWLDTQQFIPITDENLF